MEVTIDGTPWILADDYSLQSDSGFTSYVEGKLNDLGLLQYGTFTTYEQGAFCDYTWHHVGEDTD